MRAFAKGRDIMAHDAKISRRRKKLPYRRYDLIAKMVEYEIKDFGESELDRVFANCASPIGCKRGVYAMLADGLTMDEVRPTLRALDVCRVNGVHEFVSHSAIEDVEWCTYCGTRK
jgi:hypothetical protein